MANPLESFKKLPTWGKVAVAGGGAGAVYVAWRMKQNATAASAAPAADTGSGIDPETGYPVGSAQDEAALAELQGGYPVGSYTNGVDTGTVGTTSGYGTIAQWAAAAQAGLADIGFDPQTVADALGAYVSGQKLTSAEASIVNTARAEFDSSGLDLPAVVLTSSTGPATTGNTTPTITAGRVVSVSSNDAVVAWTGVGDATQWRVTITGPGKINGKTSTVNKPEATYGGLEAGHTYEVTVTPVGPGGKAGKSGKITVKTTKGK